MLTCYFSLTLLDFMSFVLPRFNQKYRFICTIFLIIFDNRLEGSDLKTMVTFDFNLNSIRS